MKHFICPFRLGDVVRIITYQRTADHLPIGGIGTVIDWTNDRDGFVEYLTVRPLYWPKDKPLRYSTHYYRLDNLELYTNGLVELQMALKENNG